VPEPQNAARDRFICRREGHKPSVTVTRISGVPRTTLMCKCLRCGQWIEAEREA
jgi:hypothetical protein